MTYAELAEAARVRFEALTPEEQRAHRADQAVSYAFHCAKSFRLAGGTYEEFVEKYGEELKAQWLANHS
jgi:hypothetical protein